jgi:hypothetical protein
MNLPIVSKLEGTEAIKALTVVIFSVLVAHVHSSVAQDFIAAVTHRFGPPIAVLVSTRFHRHLVAPY